MDFHDMIGGLAAGDSLAGKSTPCESKVVGKKVLPASQVRRGWQLMRGNLQKSPAIPDFSPSGHEDAD